MYILTIKFKEDKSILANYVAEHTKWVKKAFVEKIFVMAGQKTELNGGVILAVNMPKEKLRDLLNQDPFVKYGLAEYKITHFEPAFYQEEFSSFVSE